MKLSRIPLIVALSLVPSLALAGPYARPERAPRAARSERAPTRTRSERAARSTGTRTASFFGRASRVYKRRGLDLKKYNRITLGAANPESPVYSVVAPRSGAGTIYVERQLRGILPQLENRLGYSPVRLSGRRFSFLSDKVDLSNYQRTTLRKPGAGEDRVGYDLLTPKSGNTGAAYIERTGGLVGVPLFSKLTL